MSGRRRWAIGLIGIAAVVVLVAGAYVVAYAWPGPAGAGQSPTSVVATTSIVATTSPTRSPTPTPRPTLVPSPSAVLIGAGDICRLDRIDDAGKTAALIGASPAAPVFTLGDNSNESGTANQYANCYGKTWGTFKSRTNPTPGNHDQITSHGAPYYAYFGSAAGPAGKGYYS